MVRLVLESIPAPAVWDRKRLWTSHLSIIQTHTYTLFPYALLPTVSKVSVLGNVGGNKSSWSEHANSTQECQIWKWTQNAFTVKNINNIKVILGPVSSSVCSSCSGDSRRSLMITTIHMFYSHLWAYFPLTEVIDQHFLDLKTNVFRNLSATHIKTFIWIPILTRCVVLHPVDVLRARSLYDPPSAAPRPAGSNLVGCGIAIKTWRGIKGVHSSHPRSV